MTKKFVIGMIVLLAATIMAVGGAATVYEAVASHYNQDPVILYESEPTL